MEHGLLHEVRAPRGEVRDDLATERVADERRAPEAHRPHSGGEGVREPGHVQDAGRLLTLAEAGQVGRVDPEGRGEEFQGWEHVPAGDDQPVHEDYRWASFGRRAFRHAGMHPQAIDQGPTALRF